MQLRSNVVLLFFILLKFLLTHGSHCGESQNSSKGSSSHSHTTEEIRGKNVKKLKPDVKTSGSEGTAEEIKPGVNSKVSDDSSGSNVVSSESRDETTDSWE